MDWLSDIRTWLSDNEAAISAVAAMIVIGGVVLAGLRLLVRRQGDRTQEKAPSAATEAASTADSSPPDLDPLTIPGFEGRPAIAVLPLENLSGDPEQEYFADGMTEALISDLARISALSVISRTSVMQYKGARKPLREIARELGVNGIIEGTVMRAGDRVRITAQLIDARSDRHLWSDRYDRELSDVLALQSDVAQAVAEHVRIELTPEEHAALTPSRTIDPRAYDAYLRGLELRGTGHLVGVWGPRAIEEFERAVELDPNFAEGWAELAEARHTLGRVGFDRRRRSEFPKARDAAEQALEIDNRLGAAHSVLGGVRLFYDWDFLGARRSFERAVQLSPSDPHVLNGYAWYLLHVEGRTEEALDFYERLLRVAPLDPIWRGERAGHFFFARQYERALEEAERIRALDSHFVHMDECTAYFMLGRVEDAYCALIAFCKRGGAGLDRFREAAERGWAEGGWEGLWRAYLEEATSIEGFSPWLIVCAYALIGEVDEAFDWLERGYRERDPLIVQLKTQPQLDPLRSDPRYHDLVRRIGIPKE